MRRSYQTEDPYRILGYPSALTNCPRWLRFSHRRSEASVDMTPPLMCNVNRPTGRPSIAMEQTVSLSRVQRSNLTLLLLMRDSALTDQASAVCKFGLSTQDISALASRSPDELLSFVCDVGDQSLFHPTPSLRQLLDLPSSLAPIAAFTAACFGETLVERRASR